MPPEHHNGTIPMSPLKAHQKQPPESAIFRRLRGPRRGRTMNRLTINAIHIAK